MPRGQKIKISNFERIGEVFCFKKLSCRNTSLTDAGPILVLKLYSARILKLYSARMTSTQEVVKRWTKNENLKC